MSTQSIEPVKVALPLELSRPTYLMCSPRLYDVSYVINPWMIGNLHTASRDCATEQWQRLHNALTDVADVRLIEPQTGSPDMVFTANAGLERNGTVVLSRFFHVERQTEERYFRHWFQSSGYNVLELPPEISFEGEGDALFSIDGERLWVGYGQRTALESHPYLQRAWNVEVISLRLIDPRFYHLDTCFAPLEDGFVIYYPNAFDCESVSRIEAFYPVHKRICVSEKDAVRFACNAINVGRTILINEVSRELIERLEAEGFDVIPMPLSEFLKAGGAAKCLVMKISFPVDLDPVLKV